MAQGVSHQLDFSASHLGMLFVGPNHTNHTVWHQTKKYRRFTGLGHHAIHSQWLATFNRQQFAYVFGHGGPVWQLPQSGQSGGVFQCGGDRRPGVVVWS